MKNKNSLWLGYLLIAITLIVCTPNRIGPKTQITQTAGASSITNTPTEIPTVPPILINTPTSVSTSTPAPSQSVSDVIGDVTSPIAEDNDSDSQAGDTIPLTEPSTPIPIPPTATPKSVDEGRIYFQSNRDGNWEIYVINPNGGNLTNLTNHPGNDSVGHLSPDGQRITFMSNRDGSSEVYVMNADGSEQIRLTNNPASDSPYAWSQDGQKIIFYSNRDGDSDIYSMNADGSDPKNLTNDQVPNDFIAWLPNGQHIVFSRDDKIYDLS